jgi:hypothetical protein
MDTRQLAIVQRNTVATYVAILLKGEFNKSTRAPRRFPIHPINQKRDELGYYATLVQKLRDDEDKFFRVFFRISGLQFEDILGKI